MHSPTIVEIENAQQGQEPTPAKYADFNAPGTTKIFKGILLLIERPNICVRIWSRFPTRMLIGS